MVGQGALWRREMRWLACLSPPKRSGKHGDKAAQRQTFSRKYALPASERELRLPIVFILRNDRFVE
jgi:hypothetical protein